MIRPLCFLGVAFATLALAGCGPDAPPSNATAPTNAAAPKPADSAGPAAPAPAAAKPLATTGTSWPGVEARLTSARAKGSLLVVEIQLANTGAAPVSIERYSVADATMTDDKTKRVYEVYTPPGGQPAATADLTQTLAPGETTTVNAAFPLPSVSELVTLTVPKMGLFEAIPLKPHPEPVAGGPDDRARQKAENRARAMSAGRDGKKGQ
jgi:hypothetical protein